MRPFTIAVSAAELDDLRDRLRRTRFRTEFADEDWADGTPQPWLRELVRYWLRDYDWRRTERALNALPQVAGEFAGLGVHAFHVRSPHETATPLLLCHGWPGSVVEFLDCLPLLTDPTAHGGRAEDAFHVVLPSMPGFGLSGPTTRAGADVPAIAAAYAELSERLGYRQVLAQGGDWGAFVVRQLGLAHPGRLLGAHINFPWAVPPPPDSPTRWPRPRRRNATNWSATSGSSAPTTVTTWCRRPVRTASGPRWRTPRPDSRRGCWRSSTPGPTPARGCPSASTGCWTTRCCTG
ncbi:epoxide hydrolase [Saccharomonospora sp. NPDC006951]